MSDIAYALERLNDLIDGGWEFDGAAAKVANEESVSREALVEMYDAQFKHSVSQCLTPKE